jgi:hypothetical protein
MWYRRNISVNTSGKLALLHVTRQSINVSSSSLLEVTLPSPLNHLVPTYLLSLLMENFRGHGVIIVQHLIL